MPERGPHPRQRVAPYLEALRSYAARRPRRAMVPGHKGGIAADGDLRDALSAGRAGARPADAHRGRRHHVRRRGRPVRGRTAARGRGVGRPAHVVADQRRLAGQSGGLPGHRPARDSRRRAAHGPRQHDRRPRPGRAAAHLRRARGRRAAGRRTLRPACGARRGAREHPRRHGGDRRVAHLPRRGGRRRQPRARRPRARRGAGRRRGVGRAPGLHRCPARARAGRWAQTSSSRAPTSTAAA